MEKTYDLIILGAAKAKTSSGFRVQVNCFIGCTPPPSVPGRPESAIRLYPSTGKKSLQSVVKAI